ncbi:hypothetical protein ACOME3_005148 [Neoechinorhynchus agilis]
MFSAFERLAFLVILVFNPVNNLLCYECFSTRPSDCKVIEDFFIVECLNNITQYCWTGVIGELTYRTCASGLCQGRVPLHDNFLELIFDGIPTRYIMENRCCATDLCNGVVSLQTIGALIIPFIAIIIGNRHF